MSARLISDYLDNLRGSLDNTKIELPSSGERKQPETKETKLMEKLGYQCQITGISINGIELPTQTTWLRLSAMLALLKFTNEKGRKLIGRIRRGGYCCVEFVLYYEKNGALYPLVIKNQQFILILQLNESIGKYVSRLTVRDP